LLGNELGLRASGSANVDTDTPPAFHFIELDPASRLLGNWRSTGLVAGSAQSGHARQQDAGCVGTKNGENRVSLTRADGADHLISATLNRPIA